MPTTQSEVIEDIVEKASLAMHTMGDQDLRLMLKAWATAKSNITAEIQAVFPGEMWSLLEMQGNKTSQLLQAIDQQINGLTLRLVDITAASGVQQFQSAQVYGAYALDQATPPNITSNLLLLPEQSVRALLATPFQGAMYSQSYGFIGDAMASDIRDQLIQSMINGESMPEAAQRLDDVMGKAGRGYVDRTLKIARTEITRAQALGQWDLYTNQNKDLMDGEPAWHATADDRLCPWCLGRSGKTPTQIKKLSLHARGKSDPFHGSTTIPLHPHCRCAWLPRLKSWKDLGINIDEEGADDVRTIRLADQEDGTRGKVQDVSVDTFNAWQKSRAKQLGLT